MTALGHTSSALTYEQRRKWSERRRGILERLHSIDRDLVAKGWHAISDTWWDHFEDTRDDFVSVVMGGRRSGKSQSYMRLAVATCLEHEPIPGDVGVFGIFSQNRTQAHDRVNTCAQILDALGYVEVTRSSPGESEYKKLTDRVILGNGSEIRVVTASTGAAVSATMIGAMCDEVSHWQDASSGKNPANEIIRMLLPSMATIVGSQCAIVSAPKNKRDPLCTFFAEAEETPLWSARRIATWHGNPTLSEQFLRSIAQDEFEFLRAFAAIPVDIGSRLLFTSDILDSVFCDREWTDFEGPCGVGVDLGFVRNHASFVALTRQQAGILHGVHRKVWAPTIHGALRPSRVLGEMAEELRDYTIDRAMADSHYRESLREILPVQSGKPTGSLLIDARERALEGEVAMPSEWVDLREELERVEWLDSGEIYLPRDPSGAHCDLASAWAHAVAASVLTERARATSTRSAHRTRISRAEARLNRALDKSIARVR